MNFKIFITLLSLLFTCATVNAAYIGNWDPTLVKENANQEAKTLDTVRRGQVVSVVKTEGDWSYIKYVAFQQYKYGWVKSDTITDSYPMTSSKPNENAYYRDLEKLKKQINEEEKQDPEFQRIYEEYQKDLQKLDDQFNVCIQTKSKPLCEHYRHFKEVDVIIKRNNADSRVRDKYSKRFYEEDLMLQQIHNIKREPLYPVVNVNVLN